MVAVLLTGLFAAAWFSFASRMALRTLGDPVEGPIVFGRPPRYPHVRKDVERANGESLSILIEELDHDFERAGLAFVEYWNPGADLLALRFRLLRVIALRSLGIEAVARWAISRMADTVEWGFRASRYVPVGK